MVDPLVPVRGPQIAGGQTAHDTVLSKLGPRDIFRAAPTLDMLIATEGPHVAGFFVAEQFADRELVREVLEDFGSDSDTNQEVCA